jgi:malate dehydrogenase (oxaloacetate-decarboxylating)
MKIAAEVTVEIGETRFSGVVDTLCAGSCEIRSARLEGKAGTRSVYNFHLTYSDIDGFKKVLAYFDDEANDCRMISIRNYLDEMIENGLVTVTGNMTIDNIEDYQMNVLGVSHLVREKILESENPVRDSGICRSVGLLSCLREKGDRQKKMSALLHSDAEIEAAVLGRFSRLNGYPLIIRYDLQEDLVKYLKALEPGFSGFRIDYIDDNESPDIHEQIAEELSVPVVSVKYDEMPIFILAALQKLVKKHKYRTKDCNVGFIGLDVSAIRLARLLRKAGYMRVLGFDNNEKSMFQFERESGLATTPENIVSNAEIVILLKNQFAETDLVRMRPGLSIISLISDPEAEGLFAAKKGCGDIISGEWADGATLYPGMLKGKAGSHSAGISDASIIAIADLIAQEETPEGQLLPDVFSSIHEKVAACIAAEE